MKNNKKLKGFTLVELLVVIAILAVLATVSVVGYTSFINKANNSNALTECKQAEDIVLSDLISTGKKADAEVPITVGSGKITFKYAVGQGKVEIKYEGEVPAYTDISDKIKGTLDASGNVTGAAFPDTYELDGYFFTTNETGKIAYITSNKKGIAIWESKKSPETDTSYVDDIETHYFAEASVEEDD